MSPYILDTIFFLWLVIGTMTIKSMLRKVASGRLGRAAFILLTLPLGALPLLTLQLELFPFSAVSVILSGIILFWFAILLSRVDNAT